MVAKASTFALALAVVAAASAASAATPYGPAEIADCVARSGSYGGSGGDLDSMGLTEYDLKVGRCIRRLDRFHRRGP
jgi:hypothetical protein